MEGNKDDAAKCLRIGKGALEAGDRARAIKFLSKAKRLDPSLPVDHLLSPLLDPQDDSPASASSSSSPPAPPEPAAAAAEGAEADGLRERKQKGKKRQEEGQEDTVAREYTAEQLEVVRQVKKHTRDYYQILGLDKECTVEDVRKAYRKLSLKVHPDKNKAPGAEDAFKAVSKAFQCLSDPESRKRYNMVGSDEPVTYNRRPASNARAYNGFYEDDIDPDEIFRNFFFGGMAPATTRQYGQFGTSHFRTGRMHAHGPQNSGGSTVRMLVQLLPVLLLLLLNFLPSSEPVYSLNRNYPYEHKFQTPRGVTYYVKLPNFEEHYPHQSTERATLERHVERDYYSIVTQNCRVEMQRRQWGLSYQTPHCDMLKKFEETAQ
jgi:DnaJ homolog subfamily B member 12